MPVVPIEHIEIDERGRAKIVGSRIKVIHLVMCRMAEAQTIEQVHEAYPHLTMAQIHAAFAYYHDHKAELDAEIEESRRQAEEMRRQAGPSPVAERLRAMGKLP